MSTRCQPRPAAIAPVLALVAMLVAGCAEQPAFHPSTEYTPESLAQELAFRYKALSPDARKATKTRKPQKGAVGTKDDEKSAVKAASKAATKKELPKTIDDVLDDIEAKSATIKDMPRVQVFSKMADALDKDPSLPEEGRRTLAGKLREMAGG